MELLQYQTADGRRPVAEWLGSFKDTTVSARIAARLQRLTLGLRGDWKSVGVGVFELRVDIGPGYRVYCAQHHKGMDHSAVWRRQTNAEARHREGT